MSKSQYLLVIILIAALCLTTEAKLGSKSKAKFTKSHLHSKNKAKQDEPEPVSVELPDVAHSGHHEFNEFLDIYRNHHMSSGEIRLVFRTADRNRDNKVSFAEWADFHTIFVAPFEMIDQRKEYWLEAADLTFGIDPETGGDWLSGIAIDPTSIDDLVEQFDRWNNGDNLNFADYLFLRKANLGMKLCAGEQGIGARQLACGLTITSPGRMLTSLDTVEVFQLSSVIEGGQTTSETAYLDFLHFIQVSHLFYYFTEFSLPFEAGIINKKQIINAIDNGVLPTTLSAKEVSSFFASGLESLPFRAFGGLLWAQRVFSKFDADQSRQLDLAEWNLLLSREGPMKFNAPLLKLMDSIVQPTQEQIEEQAIKRFGRPATERDYLINFLQTKYKSHSHHKKGRLTHKLRFRAGQVQENASFDDPPREKIFRMFNGMDDQMNYHEFAEFIKYSWMFQNYDTQRSGYINDAMFWQGMKDDSAPIPLNREELQINNQAADWIGGHTGMNLNLKQFFVFFRWQEIFEWLKTTGMQVHAIQKKVEQGFVKLGLRLAASTESLMHDGYDQLMQEKHYHFKQMIMYALEDEVMAQQLMAANDFKESRR